MKISPRFNLKFLCRFFYFFLLLAIFFLSPVDSFGVEFLKIEGIIGESKDKFHLDWIDLLSIDFQGNFITKMDSFKQITFRKQIDLSSPVISQSTITGKIYPKALIHFCKDDLAQVKCNKYEFTNIYFTRYYIYGDLENTPIEEISFEFEKILTTSTNFSEVSLQDKFGKKLSATENINLKIPKQMKKNFEYWVNNYISDKKLIKDLEFLVNEKIITLDKKEFKNDFKYMEIPLWFKHITNWWIQGQISEEQFLSNIKWLIDNNLIKGIGNQ